MLLSESPKLRDPISHILRFLRLFLCSGGVVAIVLTLSCTTLEQRLREMWGIQVSADKAIPVVQTDEGMGWGVVSHPFLCPIGSGRIAVTYWLAGDGVYGGKACADWPLCTADHGRSWTVETIFNGMSGKHWWRIIRRGEHFRYDIGPFFGWVRLRDGSVISRSVHFQGSGYRARSVEWSSDGTATCFWSKIVVDSAQKIVGAVCAEHPACMLPDGSVIAVGYCRLAASQRSSVVCLRSTDRCRSYKILSIVAEPDNVPWSREGPNESAVALIGPNELLCIMRTGGGGWSGRATSSQPLLEARSYDQGRTWKLRKLLIRGVSPKLVFLRENLLVLATGRPGNTIYLSTNGGRTWRRAIELTACDAQTSGYCSILALSSTDLLAVYDLYDMDPKGFWLWEPHRMNGIFARLVHFRVPR